MTLQFLPLDQLQPAPWNPRGAFDDAGLAELTESIRAQGVLTPVLVRQVDGRHEIIAGHRRVRAAQLAGLETVPVRVGRFTDAEAREVALVENLQREDIRPMEEAHAFAAMLPDHLNLLHGASAIAVKIGKPVSYVWDRLQLTKLVRDAQRLLASDRITVWHAIILAKLSPENQARLIDLTRFGLFAAERALYADDVRDDVDDDEWHGLKAVTPAEFQRYVTEHVRFDPARAAESAPLEFGPVATQVEAAQAQPKRGRKVIHITRDYTVPPSVKNDEDPIYTAKRWRRADGLESSVVCERSVLGVVVVGPGYGEAFPVCVHKSCETHWKPEASQAQTSDADTSSRREARPTRAERDADRLKAIEKQRREEQERKAWQAERPSAMNAFAAHLLTRPFSAEVVRQVAPEYRIKAIAREHQITLTDKTAVAVLVLAMNDPWCREEFARVTKPFKFAWKAPAGGADAAKAGKKRGAAVAKKGKKR